MRKSKSGKLNLGTQAFDALPPKCVSYIRRVEELIGVPIALLSTYPNAKMSSSFKTHLTVLPPSGFSVDERATGSSLCCLWLG